MFATLFVHTTRCTVADNDFSLKSTREEQDMGKRIRIVTPIISAAFLRQPEVFQPVAGSQTEISQVQITRGPASIECELDEALAVPDTVARIIEAEREGIDAVVIDCMGDPALKAAREAVAIPVLGPGETTMHIASMLGHRFSIVTTLSRCIPMQENLAKVYGIGDKLASIRAVDIPVLELEEDTDRLVEALLDQSIEAIDSDGAHVIILGCTGMIGSALALEQGLQRRGYTGVPVIDPVPATIKIAEALVDLRLSHSKRTYPNPPAKRIVGYDLPERSRVAVHA
jgi:allantoin racemase